MKKIAILIPIIIITIGISVFGTLYMPKLYEKYIKRDNVQKPISNDGKTISSDDKGAEVYQDSNTDEQGIRSAEGIDETQADNDSSTNNQKVNNEKILPFEIEITSSDGITEINNKNINDITIESYRNVPIHIEVKSRKENFKYIVQNQEGITFSHATKTFMLDPSIFSAQATEEMHTIKNTIRVNNKDIVEEYNFNINFKLKLHPIEFSITPNSHEYTYSSKEDEKVKINIITKSAITDEIIGINPIVTITENSKNLNDKIQITDNNYLIITKNIPVIENNYVKINVKVDKDGYRGISSKKIALKINAEQLKYNIKYPSIKQSIFGENNNIIINPIIPQNSENIEYTILQVKRNEEQDIDTNINEKGTITIFQKQSTPVNTYQFEIKMNPRTTISNAYTGTDTRTITFEILPAALPKNTPAIVPPEKYQFDVKGGEYLRKQLTSKFQLKYKSIEQLSGPIINSLEIGEEGLITGFTISGEWDQSVRVRVSFEVIGNYTGKYSEIIEIGRY